MKKLEQQVNESKGKNILAFGIALTVLGGLIPIGAGITDVLSKFNPPIHHVIFKDMESALVTGGITLGVGLISAVYGSIKYYNSTKY
jgi:hypothetical protein